MAALTPWTWRAPTMLVLLAAVTISFLAAPASATLENKTGQVTVFWGRHKNEGSLREACDTGRYTTVIISFLDVYGVDGKYHLDLSGHPLGRVGAEIKHCQSKGVLVSLAVGGFGGDYSLPTRQSALDLSAYLWNAFLGGAKAGVRRPFGDARLDGVDLFLEHAAPGGEHYDVLAKELAKHKIRGGKRKPLRLTATPRCKFPDERVRKALDTGVFERVHVRFYGDDQDCRVYWQELWGNWTAAYPYSKVFFGLPASPEAGQGYVFPKEIYYSLLPVAQTAANYGGVMLWDRYYDKLNDLSSFVTQWA